jgi:hypothetical protein
MSTFFTPVVSGAGQVDDGEAMLHAIQKGASWQLASCFQAGSSMNSRPVVACALLY